MNTAAQSSPLYLEYANELRREKIERVLVIFLDEQLQVIAHTYASEGNKSHAEFRARSVFAPALIHDAKNIIVVHNHPSGSVLPSPADYLTTMVLSHAGTILEITVIDHVIVTDTDYFSFRNAGIL